MSYRKGNTRLFSIRVPEYLHSEFRKYSKERDVSMSNLLIGYMERCVDGKDEGYVKTKENLDFDPLIDIRAQYKEGVDF